MADGIALVIVGRNARYRLWSRGRGAGGTSYRDNDHRTGSLKRKGRQFDPVPATRSEQAILPSHLGHCYLVPCLATAHRCPSETSGDRLWGSTTARGLHGSQ